MVLQKPLTSRVVERLLTLALNHASNPIETVVDRFRRMHSLSPRQAAVVVSLATGRTTRTEIADAMGCSEKTVDAHLQAIFNKTGQRSATALLVAPFQLACHHQLRPPE